MNRPILIFTMSLMLITQIANSMKIDPFIKFKESVDSYDDELVDRGFSDKDVLAWWGIADQNVLSVYNDFLQGESPPNYLKKMPNTDAEYLKEISVTPECVNLTYYTTQPPDFLANEIKNQQVKKWTYLSVSSCGQGSIRWAYNELRPPDGASQEFSVSIMPLTTDNTIFFVELKKSGVGTGKNYHSLPTIETFRIMVVNISTGKSEITAKLEESNFFKQIIIPGKLKYWNKTMAGEKLTNLPISKYDLAWGLNRDTIRVEGKTIKFETRTSRCMIGGGPCYDEMITSWVYANKKLIATHYIDKYRGDWNENKRQYEYKEDKVQLSH